MFWFNKKYKINISIKIYQLSCLKKHKRLKLKNRAIKNIKKDINKITDLEKMQ